ncbi:MAG TPA: M6 family metalloprotease domain-containing protein [Humisphaera sp.]|nr:M6 family metalloprotease domain-containing protein [Humisphaera sp.]
MMLINRSIFALCLIASGICGLGADAPTTAPSTAPTTAPATAPVTPPANPLTASLADFKTTATAQTTRINSARIAEPAARAYLGAHLEMVGDKLTIGFIESHSPADEAGLHDGDVIRRINSTATATLDAFRRTLATKQVGERIRLTVVRNGKEDDFYLRLGPISQPVSLGEQRASLGLAAADQLDEDGAKVYQVEAGSAAARAGVEVGDVLLRLDDTLLTPPIGLSDLLAYRSPGDTVNLTVLRDGKQKQLTARLAVDTGTGRGGFGRGRNFLNDIRRGTASAPAGRAGAIFRRDTLRLLVLGVEFSDVKHNPRVADKDWEEEFFSRKTFTDRNATGQQVFGSVNDYFIEQSVGALHVEGKMAGWIAVDKPRVEYDKPPEGGGAFGGRGSGGGANPLLGEVLDKFLRRDGRSAMDQYDAVIFIYAGNRATSTRGSIYWPHKGTAIYRGQRWQYFICEEGLQRMSNVSLFGHEAGHILGLPDLYAQPENPGSIGLGIWCAMAEQLSGGRPQHYSAWCKEQLGWIKPVLIDPTVKQKLILGPIEDSATECYKVLVRPDGSEYFLLENRQRKGFDTGLPADGLLIWRVIGNRPTLEASHGIGGPPAASVYLANVPYPSPNNTSFTPYTTPSSRSQLGNGLPVYITDIRKLEDGRITFCIGYQFE